MATIGKPYVNQSNVAVDIKDTPYTLVGSVGWGEVELAYGDVIERWRRASLPNIAGCSNYRIVVDGVAYRFAYQVDKAGKVAK